MKCLLRTTRPILAVLCIPAGCMLPPERTPTHLSNAGAAANSADVVHVAPPTGERAADRASILAALERVQPGGTVQFAPGTYLIGPGLEATGTRVTLVGDPGGTTIRGCDPAEFADFRFAVSSCNALALSGGHQTVRHLTFEYAWHGLYVGCCLAADVEALERGERHQRPQAGGHLIEDNTFRYTPNGLRVVGESPEPTVVRNNRFIDVYHAIGINGRTVHFLNNDISVRNPERVPHSTHPGDAINITPYGPPGDHTSCADNLVAGNRIEGYTHGIRILLLEPGTSCRNNVIRDNTIAVHRVRFVSHWWGIRLTDEADSTVVGVPLSLMKLPAASEGNGFGRDGVIEDNLIEGNRIVGAEGVGIEVLHASRNRIAGNTVSDVARREPFPGNVLEGEPLAWRTANGAGIWISPGSEGNSLEGNVFEGIAGASVVREGELETADGVRLYYRVEGEGRDTVVVLHGGPSLGHGYLAPDLLPLTRGRAVVHHDQRGTGRSTPLTDPERLSIERHVQDLEALRTHLGLERLALLGHSWGGMLAARYAAAHPERVARILLLEPMVPARDPFMAIAGARAREIVGARLDETERARLDSLVATADVDDAGAHCGALFSLLRPIYFKDPTAATRSRADFCAGTPETLRIRSAVDAAIIGSLGAWDVRPAVGNVTSPVLVLHGAEGAIAREAMEAWADAFPNGRLITIERAGHYLHVDRPDAFFPAAEVFFGGGWPEAEAPGSGAVAAGETALDESVDVQAVESAIRGYLDAYAAMDPALLRARTTEDFHIIENGYTAGVDRVVEGMDPAGALPFTHYVLQDLEIEVAGAIAVYRLVVDWYRGEARADGGIGTGHLRRSGDGWKLARDHMTLLPGRRPVAAAALREYAGEYRGLDAAGGDDRLHLEVDGDRLFMTRPDGRPLFGGIRRLEVIPESGEGFHLEFWGGLVQFERRDGDEIETLVYVPPHRMPAAYRQPLRYGRIR
jgi:proline iminopeptidase